MHHLNSLFNHIIISKLITFLSDTILMYQLRLIQYSTLDKNRSFCIKNQERTVQEFNGLFLVTVHQIFLPGIEDNWKLIFDKMHLFLNKYFLLIWSERNQTVSRPQQQAKIPTKKQYCCNQLKTGAENTLWKLKVNKYRHRAKSGKLIFNTADKYCVCIQYYFFIL